MRRPHRLTASMSSLYELRSDGEGEALRLVRLSGQDAPFVVLQVMVDVGREGVPTIVGHNRAGARSSVLVAVVDGAQRVVQESTVRFYGCGC